VRIDQHREHAEAFVQLDETHAAHIGREIVDYVAILDRLLAGVES
jgi:hypothetical protein